MARKLPVFKTVGDAFGTAFFPPVFGTWFFCGYLLLIFLWQLVLGVMIGFSGTVDHPMVEQILSITWIPLIAPFAVSVHRHIILHEAVPTLRRLLGSFFSKRNMTFAWYLFLVSAPFFVLQLLAQTPRIGFPLWFLGFALLQIPYAIVLAGFIIFLPFIAIDSKQTFARCWERTKGNILRVFSASVIIGAAGTIVWRILVLPLQDAAFGGGDLILVPVVIVVTIVFLLMSAALAVAVVSHVFVFLSAEPKVTDDEAKIPKDVDLRRESAQEWEREWIKAVESDNKYDKKDTKKPS